MLTNPVEAYKAEKHGFDVWPDLERYARESTPLSAIDEADLERMKWHGIFARKMAADGCYMIRVRIPGCELDASQARAVASIARKGLGIVDVTTRGNVQVQGLRIEDLPCATNALHAVGLTAKQTGHDNVRNVICHPWAGIDPTELIDARPLCRTLTDVFLGDRQLSNLPRKFNVAVDGRDVPALHCWTQDFCLLAGHRADGALRFHLLVGGTQGQTPRLATKVPVWVREDQAAEVLYHTLRIYQEEGPRERRDRVRFRDLIDQIGVDGFLSRVEARLGYTLEPNAEPLPLVHSENDSVGWYRQKQEGHWALGVNVPLGRLTHEQLDGLADLAESFGDGTLRTASTQGVVITNIPDGSRAGATRLLNRIGLESEADSIDRNVVACTGRQFCNLAVSETKGVAFRLMERLRSQGVRLAGIKLHMSGCPNACAMTYTADIGLKGVRVRRGGVVREGFDIVVGGGVHGAVELAIPYRKGVDHEQLADVIACLVKTFDQKSIPGESFSRFWRAKLGAEHEATAMEEGEHRPDVWSCESCGHEHSGDDPPYFCPKCSALRTSFARIEDIPAATAAFAVTGPAASLRG